MLTELERVLVELGAVLDRLDLQHAVGGSVASSRYGELRSTNDVDVLVQLPPAKAEGLVQALAAPWSVEASAVQRALARRDMFQAYHMAAFMKVDLYVADPRRLLDALTLEHRKRVPVGGAEGGSICFSTAEDIVLRKLDWLRLSGGVLERQRRDVLGVLKGVGPDLDLGYLRATAGQLGLTEALESCLKDAGLGG